MRYAHCFLGLHSRKSRFLILSIFQLRAFVIGYVFLIIGFLFLSSFYSIFKITASVNSVATNGGLMITYSNFLSSGSVGILDGMP